jgi:hypothetical protein
VILVWWSNQGAAMGKPWWVQRPGSEPERAAFVRIKGNAVTRVKDDGFLHLSDGPRGIIAVDGEVFCEEIQTPLDIEEDR